MLLSSLLHRLGQTGGTHQEHLLGVEVALQGEKVHQAQGRAAHRAAQLLGGHELAVHDLDDRLDAQQGGSQEGRVGKAAARAQVAQIAGDKTAAYARGKVGRKVAQLLDGNIGVGGQVLSRAHHDEALPNRYLLGVEGNHVVAALRRRARRLKRAGSHGRVRQVQDLGLGVLLVDAVEGGFEIARGAAAGLRQNAQLTALLKHLGGRNLAVIDGLGANAHVHGNDIDAKLGRHARRNVASRLCHDDDLLGHRFFRLPRPHTCRTTCVLNTVQNS